MQVLHYTCRATCRTSQESCNLDEACGFSKASTWQFEVLLSVLRLPAASADLADDTLHCLPNGVL